MLIMMQSTSKPDLQVPHDLTGPGGPGVATERCYARAEIMGTPVVSGSESSDAGGDGYGGDIVKPPF